MISEKCFHPDKRWKRKIKSLKYKQEKSLGFCILNGSFNKSIMLLLNYEYKLYYWPNY